MNLFKFFSKRYPFIVQNISTITITGISIWLMIYLLQPFGFNTYQNNKLVASLGFGIITFICFFLSNHFLKQKFLKLKIKKWTLGAEMLYTSLLILMISFTNAIYLHLMVNENGLESEFLLKVLLYTTIIGLFPIIVLLLVKYNHILKTDLNKVIDKREQTESGTIISLSSINTKEKKFSLEIDNLLFIEALKNNVHIYYLDNNSVKTQSMRNTFTNVIEQLGDVNVFRCHRSFLINTNNIKTAKGNSNGYKIYLKNYEIPIPVSRSYTQAFYELVF